MHNFNKQIEEDRTEWTASIDPSSVVASYSVQAAGSWLLWAATVHRHSDT